VTHSPDLAHDRSQHDALRLLGLGLLVPGFTLLTALGAMVQFPIPPFGVPQTLQTLAVLLCALALGPRLGAVSMGLYVLCGIVGVPLFADGEAGWATILGQTGGYLVGFVACQPVAHWIIRRDDRSFRGWGAVVVAGLAVHGVVFLCGVPWLYVVRLLDPEAADITVWQAVYGGCVVFLPGMVLKTATATVIALMLRPEMGRRLW
jgi:biotin transport system substrate-specific component